MAVGADLLQRVAQVGVAVGVVDGGGQVELGTTWLPRVRGRKANRGGSSVSFVASCADSRARSSSRQERRYQRPGSCYSGSEGGVRKVRCRAAAAGGRQRWPPGPDGSVSAMPSASVTELAAAAVSASRARSSAVSSTSPSAFDLLAQLDQRDDAGAVLLAPEEDPLPEDVDRDHPLAPRGRAQGLALLGEPPPRGDVELVLVLEAAEQAAAAAGDLAGVEREVLVLGQAQVDRRELLEPGGAAVLPPAAADAGEPRRLVAHADLAQLDAGAEVEARSRTSARKSTRFSAVK